MQSLTLYHGTRREILDDILQQGLQPSAGWGGAGTTGVFLSGTPEGAEYWAKMAFLRHRDEKLEAATFDRKYDASQQLALLQIVIPPQYLSNLYADMEQAEDAGFEGEEADWALSLELIGDVRYNGVIPASWITLIDTARPNPLSPNRRNYLRKIARQTAQGALVQRAMEPHLVEAQMETQLDQIAETDPTPTGEYSPWLFRLLSKKEITLPEDSQKLREALQELSQIKRHLPPEHRDINQYSSYGSLRRVLTQYHGTTGTSRNAARALRAEQGQEILETQGDLQLIRATTPEAAHVLAQNTGWCVKDPKVAARYLAKAPLYFFYQRTLHSNCSKCGNSIFPTTASHGTSPGVYHCLQCAAPVQVYYANDPYVLAHPGDKNSPPQVMDIDDDPIPSGIEEELEPLLTKYLPEIFCSEHYQLMIQPCPQSGCHNSACPECFQSCYKSRCDETFCPQCVTRCDNPNCTLVVCGRHSNTCEECGTPYCQNCAESRLQQCSGCRQDVCANCIPEDSYLCSMCLSGGVAPAGDEDSAASRSNPIRELELVGDWDHNHGFKAMDRKMLTSDKAIQKIKNLWRGTQHAYDIYLVNSTETNKEAWREKGIITPLELRKDLGISKSLIPVRPGRITILFTNNQGAEKYPLTGWIMAHRFGHVIRSSSVQGGWNTSPPTGDPGEIWAKAAQKVEKLLDSVGLLYGLNTNLFWPQGGHREGARAMRNRLAIAMGLGNMRSARDRTLRTPYELNYELFAQYLLTGQIVFRPLTPRLQMLPYTWGRPTYQFLRKGADQLQNFNQQILPETAQRLQELFEELLDRCVGKIFVM